ncbi:MAG: VanW family protein [Candidatus Levybacteria bacterium]|nr:VanW family protein [Candidatus Levybacteria bacterium]
MGKKHNTHTKDNESTKKTRKEKILHTAKPVFWFLIGVFFAAFCLASLMLVYFRLAFKDRVIPGVFIGTEYVGEKTTDEIKQLFKEKNAQIGGTVLSFKTGTQSATIKAQEAGIGYDSELIAMQAKSIGSSKDVFSNSYHIINSYLNGTYLEPSFTTDTDKIKSVIEPIRQSVHVDAENALFTVENNKVVAFKESKNGKTINIGSVEKKIHDIVPKIVEGKTSGNIVISLPVTTLYPETTTEEANNFGIVEPIGSGTSHFAGSIPNRVHNVALAASKINGVLVAPNETFSFVKTIGDISKLTGYKEAYVIEGGRTVLGDGGGVCQVSTTLFRAILQAGLPVIERNQHAYRVGYYEQDSLPGVDAAVYVPSVDLKFKNDTGNYIFIQESIDLNTLTLTFTIYGKSDGRKVTLTKPIITNQSPAPEPTYQDDPTLARGVEKQVDFAAPGATTVFSRIITTKDGKEITDTFKSNYRPWRAVFLRGTKEG